MNGPLPGYTPGYMPSPYTPQAAAGAPLGGFATPTGRGSLTLDSYAPVRMGGAAGAAYFLGHGVTAAARMGGRVGSRAAAAGGASVGLGKALGLSAFITAPLVALSDYMAYRNGKITAQQRNTLIAADTAGYVAAGAAGSWLGAALAGSFLGPVGTVVGLAAGVGLGFAYERFLRPTFTSVATYPEPR